jgi:hypothetical protein
MKTTGKELLQRVSVFLFHYLPVNLTSMEHVKSLPTQAKRRLEWATLSIGGC